MLSFARLCGLRLAIFIAVVCVVVVAKFLVKRGNDDGVEDEDKNADDRLRRRLENATEDRAAEADFNRV